MSDTKPLSVLIVDDEKTNLDVLSHILSKDYEVYAAKSGKAALKLAAANRPDLILLDIIMPEMNGYETIARLKENEITARIPIMFITGLNSVANEERGLQLGAVDYITKPFSATVVEARVRSHIKIARHARMIEELGMLDLKTGLPNRKCFNLQCRIEWLRALRKNSSVHLLLVVLAGPPPDDDQMRKAASLLKDLSNTHPPGFVARIDANRFGLLLPDGDDFCAKKITEGVQDRFRDSPLFSASGEHLTVRFERFSASPTSGRSLNDLLRQTHDSRVGLEFPP